jgi:outer membrane protein assembly factor BamB
MKDHLPPTPRTLGAAPWRWPRRPPLRAWIWTAATLVLAVAAVVLWRGSDAAATSSTTARAAGAVTGTPAAALSQVWSVPGSPQPASVVERNRVVVGSEHGIRALDPRTGREVWHYTRGNARMCGATAVDGLAVAVFEVPSERHRCDQMVALSVDTGVRAWTRNVDLSTDATLVSTPRTVLAVNPTGVVAVDPTGDNIRWRYHVPSGCRLTATAGTAGTAVLQRCPGGTTLQLLDAYTGAARWTRDLPASPPPRLAGADALVSVVAGDRLRLFAAQDGAPLPDVPLPSGGDDGVGEAGTDLAVLVWAHGTVLSLDPVSGAVRWQAAARGLPGVPVAGGTGTGSGAVVLAEEDGVVLRDPVTGTETGRSSASGVPADGVATRLGDVVVVRSADRVAGYR